MKGWIKLHRKVLENPTVCKDCEYFTVWMHLLLNATHQSIPVEFKGKAIYLKPGQLIVGRKSIGLKLNVSESKVQRILKKLENEHLIRQDCSNKNRLITIVNWEKYQNNEQQSEQLRNNKRSTNEQLVNTNKNVKNDENVKNDIYREYCQTNMELLQAFRDWEEMRNRIKKPLTNRSRRLSIVELEKISTQSKEQIEVINKATLHCWLSFYNPKRNTQEEKKSEEGDTRRQESKGRNAYDYKKFFN